MAKRQSTFGNMVLTLFLVTLLASTALGFIYEITKEPIAKAKIAKQAEAIAAVLPLHDNAPLSEAVEITIEAGILAGYPATLEGKLQGLAVKTFTKKGYSGEIWLMVGFLPDGSVCKVQVLEHRETPGLGSKMDTPAFSGQFVGKNPAEANLKMKKEGGEIDAISGATISSRAYAEAIVTAHQAFLQYVQTSATHNHVQP